MKTDLKRPCKHCPFRADIPGYLRAGRVAEINYALVYGNSTFPCHKTLEDVENEDGEGELCTTPDSQHCAGAILLMLRTGEFDDNQMMRIFTRTGMDPDTYDYENEAIPAFWSWADMAYHHDSEGASEIMNRWDPDETFDYDYADDSSWGSMITERTWESVEDYG